MIGDSESSLIVAFATLVGGLFAYVAAMVLVQTIRHPPASDDDDGESDTRDTDVPRRTRNTPRSARGLLESTPY